MLTEASGRVLGKLTVEGPRGGFPLHAQHAERYVETGIALVGDAAHGIHPMAGQGANLGLRDVACLADLVGQAIAGREHPGSRRVLRRYERQRRGDNATMLNGLTALNTLFSSRSAVIGEIRRYGMQLFNHSGPLRERVAREAIGAVSD